MKTLLLLGALALAPALASAAPPVIDGNLDDLFQYAQQIQAAGLGNGAVIIDKQDALGVPQPENIYSDAKFIPCELVNGSAPPLLSHWANGTEIFYHAVAAEFGSTTLYLGVRMEGFVGDVDGNGNPDNSGGGQCNPEDNIEDTDGVSGNELIQWRFDFNCDGVPDGILKLQDNQLVGTGTLAGVTGAYAFRENAATGASGHDLEIELHLPAPLPPAFNYLGLQTNAFDGLTEDSAPGFLFVQPPRLSLSPPPDVRVCPGDKGRLSFTLTNPGSLPLAMDVTDQLPAGWTYAGGLSTNCGTGEPAIDGSKLTFAAFTLTAGASCTIAFDVLSDATCSGEGTNAFQAVGTGDSPCNKGGPFATLVESNTTLACDPALCAPEGTCRLTGGGCMNDDPDTGKRGHKQNTFGGNSSPAHEGGGPSGNSWEHILRDGRETLFNWHSWDAHVIGCSVVGVGPCHPSATNTRADFVGTGKYSLGSGGREEDGNMVAYIVDHKEGSCNKGTRDEYFITVRKGLVIGQGDIVFDRGGYIDCGNLQIHETPARLFGSGVTLPGSGVTGVALLDRAYPNPFAGSTHFAYKVAEANASVEIGVYDVAGRLVKTLAAGSQPAGVYTVTWDGSDDSGVRMAPGVYFLKSRVGGEQVVNRLIYVAR